MWIEAPPSNREIASDRSLKIPARVGGLCWPAPVSESLAADSGNKLLIQETT
jgi:hypothetical protein